MDEYIKKEMAENVFRNARKRMKPGDYSGQEFCIRDNILLNAEQIIHLIPAADVVPVVRCKDCRYSMDDKIFGGMWCRGRKVTPDWFCADGANMDGEA